MNLTAETTAKKSINKKQIALIITLSVSALIAFVTVILMDFTNIGILKIKKLTGEGLIDSHFYYSGEKLYEYLSNFNAEALKTLLTVHSIDYVFMLSVCVFEIALLVLLSGKNIKVLFLSVLAFLELLFDLSENLFVDFVIRKLPEKASLISGLCGGMTVCKWLFTIAYIVSTIIVLGCILINKFKAENHESGKTDKIEENSEETSDSAEQTVSESEE